MNASTASLERFIDHHYNCSVNMAYHMPTRDHSTPDGLEDLVNDPLTPVDILGASKKRKAVSPVAEMFDLDIETDLTPQQQQVHAAVLATVASWIGEMNHNMQESFNVQFESAVRDMRSELFEQVQSMDTANTSANKDIEDLQQENDELKNHCRILEGRLTRAEKELEDLREQFLVQEARSMRDNIKFYNIPETQDEVCEDAVRKFLSKEMKISDNDLNKIKFDRVHRTGQYRRGQNRVIVAKFNPYEGRQIVFNHVKYLDRSKNYGISEQLPRELAERKKQLIPVYKQAKREKRNAKWSMDKLIIDGKVKEVTKDKVKDVNMDTNEKATSLQPELHHTPPQTHQGSSFQGHSMKVTSQDEIVPALHAIYADSRVARATHNIYAYRIKTGSGFLEHFEDDGEWGAGSKLLNMLKENNIENTLVCTTRWYGGVHLGKVRFDHIVNVAKSSLKL